MMIFTADDEGLARSLWMRIGSDIIAAKRFQDITGCEAETSRAMISKVRKAYEDQFPPMRWREETFDEQMTREKWQDERNEWLAEDRAYEAQRRTEP